MMLVEYFAMRIKKKKLSYENVIQMYPDLKKALDQALAR